MKKLPPLATTPHHYQPSRDKHVDSCMKLLLKDCFKMKFPSRVFNQQDQVQAPAQGHGIYLGQIQDQVQRQGHYKGQGQGKMQEEEKKQGKD